MRLKLILTIIVLLVSTKCFADTPINHYSDKVISGEQTTLNIYSYPKYFRNESNQLEAIDTTIMPSQDAGWDWEVKKGVYKLRIKNDGTFEFNHLGDIVQQKINGIGFFNQSTKQRLLPAQTQLMLSAPTVSGNKITWSLPLGSTYELEYIEDNFKDVLTISLAAKNWLKNNKPNGWTVNDIWVALIYDMDLTQSTMIESKDFETDGDLNFVSGGKVKHRIGRKTVKHSLYEDPLSDGSNADKASLQWLKKKFYRAGKYVEAIPAASLDSVDGNLIFNTDITFQEGVSPDAGYSGCIDAALNAGATTTNYGGTGSLTLSSANSSFIYKFDISAIPAGSTVSDARFKYYGSMRGYAHTLYIHRVKRLWTEGDVTWVKYDASNNWTTAGALHEDDSAQTAETTINSVNGGTATSGNIATMVQAWVDGTYSNYGLRMYASNIYQNSSFSEDGTSSRRPQLTATYTAPATSTDKVFQNMTVTGGLYVN